MQFNSFDGLFKSVQHIEKETQKNRILLHSSVAYSLESTELPSSVSIRSFINLILQFMSERRCASFIFQDS